MSKAETNSSIIESITSALAKEDKIAAFLERASKSLDDFDYSVAPPPVPYLVAGTVPSGKLTILAGPGAIRKTHQLIDLAASVAYHALNATWLGSNVVDHGPVIFVSGEETRDDFFSRMYDLGVGDTRGDKAPSIYLWDKEFLANAGISQNLFELKGNSVERTKLFDALRAFAVQVKPKMIVIDTLNSLCPVDIDSNTGHGQAVTRDLGLIATESGAAVILTHHINKGKEISSASDARAAVKGTTGTIDGARNVIVMWNAPARKGETAVKAGIVEDPAHLFMAAVVKANGKGADQRERFFTNQLESGILSDVSAKVLLADIDEKAQELAVKAAAKSKPAAKAK